MLKRIIAILSLIIILTICINNLILISYASDDVGLFDGGNGTKENPYLISNSHQLKNIEKNLTAAYKLVNDIDLTYDTNNSNGEYYNNGIGWIPFEGTFEGIIDGNGKKIIGLHQNRILESDTVSTIGTGLFEDMSNATIKNLDIVDFKISYTINGVYKYLNSIYVGAFSRWMIANSNFDSVNTFGKIDIISNNVNASAISVRGGGFASFSSGVTFNNCSNNINISSDFYGYYGGFTGEANEVIFQNCINNGNIYAINTGTIKDFYVGGFSAWNYGEERVSPIEGTSKYIKCCNNGNLSGKAVGGIVSQCEDGLIKQCSNYGILNIYSMNSGGIIGGSKNTTVEESFNAGILNIYASQAYDAANIGGVAGDVIDGKKNKDDFLHDNIVKNSYNIGDVNIISLNIDAQIGGIVGYLSGHMKSCYNIGKVNLSNFDENAAYYKPSGFQVHTGTFSVGAVIGGSKAMQCCDDVYYLVDTKPEPIFNRCKVLCLGSLEDKPLELMEMTEKSSFYGFDFENVWNIGIYNDFDFPQLENNLIKGILAERIELSHKNISININDSFELKAIINPANSTNKKVNWISSNKEIASVDENGNVTAKKKGTATITAETINGKKDTCLIVVKSLQGDINGDDKVNVKDWNRLYEHINETALLTEDELKCADVNGDGKVNGKDWNRLYEHITEVNPLF